MSEVAYLARWTMSGLDLLHLSALDLLHLSALDILHLSALDILHLSALDLLHLSALDLLHLSALDLLKARTYSSTQNGHSFEVRILVGTKALKRSSFCFLCIITPDKL